MSDCRKYADIVEIIDGYYVATVWTGANYYIGVFKKAGVDSLIAEFPEANLTPEKVILSTHVNDMNHLCKHEDFEQEMVEDWIHARFKEKED